MSARKAKRPARKAAKMPVIPATVVDDMVAAISLVEVTMRSLQAQEIGAPQQVVLDVALKRMWAVHDVLTEVAADDDDEVGDE